MRGIYARHAFIVTDRRIRKWGVNVIDLLEFAVRAHGGLDRWNKVTSIRAAASIGGAIWYLKGKGDGLKDVVLTADTKKERVVMDFPGQDKRTIFEPLRVRIEKTDGTLVEERENPEKSFEGHQRDTPWTTFMWLISAARRCGLTCTRHLYIREGFEREEITSIVSNGETWRRLKVAFPDAIKSHTREQISCFGPDGLIRRHDYTVDILGGATGLNYASDYRDVDGIIVAAKRRIYAYEGDYQIMKEPLLVSIDLEGIEAGHQ
jgi:hypothetical protein